VPWAQPPAHQPVPGTTVVVVGPQQPRAAAAACLPGFQGLSTAGKTPPQLPGMACGHVDTRSIHRSSRFRLFSVTSMMNSSLILQGSWILILCTVFCELSACRVAMSLKNRMSFTSCLLGSFKK
jgi:hypothetical protein